MLYLLVKIRHALLYEGHWLMKEAMPMSMFLLDADLEEEIYDISFNCDSSLNILLILINCRIKIFNQ